MTAWVDGLPCGELPVTDRGLHYGDGVFETMACHEGRARRLPRHLARLGRGCERLGLPLPPLDGLRAEIEAVAAELGEGVVKLIVTRGSGGRGYAPPLEAHCRRMLLSYPAPNHPSRYAEEGIRLRVARTRLGVNPLLAGIKHLNRLEQVLARGEWRPEDEDVPEALMLDTAGRVVEGTMTNVFGVVDGGLVTPRLDDCGIAGVLREVVLEIAARGSLPVTIGELRLEDLNAMDELFVGNSLLGIWPVVELESRRYRPGPITRHLQAEVQRCD